MKKRHCMYDCLRTLAGLLLGALFAAAIPAQAQVGVPASLGSNQLDNTSNTTMSITTSQPVPKGGSIFVSEVSGIADRTSTTELPPGGASCSDSAGNVYIGDVGDDDGLDVTGLCSTHGIAAQLPAGSTITVTWVGGIPSWNQRVRAFFVTGGLLNPALDKVAANLALSGSPSSGPTATTVQANELLFGLITDSRNPVSLANFVAGTNGTATNCATSGSPTYTSLSGVGNAVPSIFGMYCIVAATGTFSANATITTNDRWSALLATYKADTKFTSTALTADVNPAAFGQTVTLTATVHTWPGLANTPGGNVIFNDGTTTLGTSVLDSNGVATFSTSSLSVNAHSITAVYAGDSNFDGSTSAALSEVINQASSSTALNVDFNPALPSQTVTFTATVTDASAGSSATPGSTVTFKDSNTTLGTGTLSGGVATFSTLSLGLGSHSITAVYGGDNNFIGSTSAPLSEVIKQANSSTALNVDINPALPGQTVTFTATVTDISAGLSATPSGTVTFKDSTTTLGTGTLSGSIATFSTSLLSVGSHSITAVYGGDNDFTGSTSSPLSEVIHQANSSTALNVDINHALPGQIVTFTATVTDTSAGSNATPGGTVTFKDFNSFLGTGTLSGGIATFSTSLLASGSHSITAVYGGDNDFIGSTSAPLTEVIKTSSSTSLSADFNQSSAGKTVTFTATVSSGGGTPTGTATFMEGSSTLGTGTLSSGIATFATSSLAAGSHSITAVYGGDANFIGSTSNTVNETVLTAPIIVLANSSNLQLQRGGTTSTLLTVNAAGGLGTVIFVCSGLPSGVTCNFNPPSENQLNAQVNMTLTSSAGSSSLLLPGVRRIPPSLYSMIPLLLGLGMLINMKRRLRLALGLAMLALLLALIGCGGSSSGPGNGSTSFPLTVTGTSATGASGSTTVTLTIF